MRPLPVSYTPISVPTGECRVARGRGRGDVEGVVHAAGQISEKRRRGAVGASSGCSSPQKVCVRQDCQRGRGIQREVIDGGGRHRPGGGQSDGQARGGKSLASFHGNYLSVREQPGIRRFDEISIPSTITRGESQQEARKTALRQRLTPNTCSPCPERCCPAIPPSPATPRPRASSSIARAVR